MIKFREQFIVLLNYMEKSKREKFALKNDVLKNFLFDSKNINEIDDKFKEEKLNILNIVKDENKEYLEAINEKINFNKFQSENNFEQFYEKYHQYIHYH